MSVSDASANPIEVRRKQGETEAPATNCGTDCQLVTENPVTVYQIDPLTDKRWDDFVARHPLASAFHSRGWLEALQRTYGYQPVALTTTPPGKPLRNAITLCRVSSWLTGDRLVSIPFADHCEPLLEQGTDYWPLLASLAQECNRAGYKYVELRPLSELNISASTDTLRPSRSYSFHELDLSPSLDQLFRGLHKDSIQRRIRRAEKAQLGYEGGWSKQLLDDFYRLLCLTRRRHQLPPQPRVWFQNLSECLGHSAQIRVVRSNAAIAAIFSLRHGSRVIYKYGCSDEKFHNLGGMPFLFWRLMQESKASGATKLDFGRSDLDNPGLIAFKDKFGTTRKTLTYYRYANSENEGTTSRWGSNAGKFLFSLLPKAFLSTAGRALYKHMG